MIKEDISFTKITSEIYWTDIGHILKKQVFEKAL